MKPLFYPESIVVIGVSEKPDNLASNVIANLRAFDYQGDLYAVGRQQGEVHGVKIVPSLDHVPTGLDLAVILTPAPVVAELMEACGRKGIRWVVVQSGGFSEFSEEGRQLEEQLLEIARRWGIRLVGPNCISVVNLEAGVCLPFASISPKLARLGSASVLAQSGGVSVTYLDRLSAAGVGVNKVVSMGNKTDLDETDYLAYLLEDRGTEMICLYLESIDDGRQLMDYARSSTKPLIVHKANRGETSQRIALSHTAALADDDRIVSGAFRQAGILRAEDFRDAVAIAQGLALPPVEGDDLVIISRSGGHAVVAADAAEHHGFRLSPIPGDFTQQVRELFRADVIAPTNPLDLGVIFDFDLYARIVEQCLSTLAPDAILLINTYSLAEAEGAHRLAQRVEEIVQTTQCPVAFCVFPQGDEAQALQHEVGLPIFTEIEEAVRGLAASRDWHRWRARRAEASPYPTDWASPSPEAARLLTEPGVLTTDQSLALCQTYGIPVAPWRVAADPEEAVRAADGLRYPVALKVLSADVTHKSDVGGVALGLGDAAAVRREAEAMLMEYPALMVQRMANSGIEVIVGGKRDPTFGPVVMFGVGGVHVEVFDDVSFRVAPLTQADAEEMIEEVRGSRLLEGIRGGRPVDEDSVVEALLALSQMMMENPQLVEVDLNPLLVFEEQAMAVDARAVVKNQSRRSRALQNRHVGL
ncbi:MAG: acetate--CoA ligase family protein [Anaerolineae bacterium]|jgi:acetyltransferase